MDILALIVSLVSLVGKLTEIVGKALADKNATHEQLVAEAKAATAEFHAAVGGIKDKLDANDAAIDKQLDEGLLK